jgi:NitT/TauT family transport system permease protein
LPSVAPGCSASEIAVGFATGACVRVRGGNPRLGYLLSFAQSTYNAALMFALILILGGAADLEAAGRLEKYSLRWN